LLSGILLLSTFMLVQLSWGCDEKDGWDCDHHDKSECHKYTKPCQPPKIQRVFLEYKTDAITFTILGKNFDDGAPAVVTLGGIFELTVNEYSGDQIIATLPIPAEEEFIYGDYKLVVSTCSVSACKEDKYCKDHGPNCKCKYCRDHCSEFKDKYCREHESKCKCKDKYSLTIADPSVPTSAIGLKIKSSEPFKSSARESLKQFEGFVECDSGFRVTGGGFSCPIRAGDETTECRIMVSEPLQDDKNNGIGWRVIAAHVGSEVALTVHAICIQIQ